MKILIIEDNIKLAKAIKEKFEDLNFVVDVNNLGKEGEELAYINKYDLILLDLNLPDKSGFEILKFLRESNISTPIIIITARDETSQRIKGLDIGADDYVIKPFEFDELVSRARAVIRRSYGRSNPQIEIGEFKIIPNTREIYIKNNQIKLSAKEFDIIEYIANRYPDVVSTEDIIEHVYDEEFDPFSSVIRVHMANLKRKLSYENKGYLKNIKGKGYVICI